MSVRVTPRRNYVNQHWKGALLYAQLNTFLAIWHASFILMFHLFSHTKYIDVRDKPNLTTDTLL
jgi:hypothetical protein